MILDNIAGVYGVDRLRMLNRKEKDFIEDAAKGPIEKFKWLFRQCGNNMNFIADKVTKP
ncbi:hypothetical protein [Noviherbaspirillum album]|nr:hypothetical protein [Noviherbaspirillum sp. CPCC 100848]